VASINRRSQPLAPIIKSQQPLDKKAYKDIFQSPAGWIATGFGVGFSPITPGTMGSLVALLPYLLLRELSLPIYLAIVLVTFLLGICVSHFVVKRLRIEDPGIVVWDEFVGQWLTLTFAYHQWYWIFVGFLLFRIFDIWKPWPVSWADRSLKGGLGVMVDDALAGIYAGICLVLLQWSFS